MAASTRKSSWPWPYGQRNHGLGLTPPACSIISSASLREAAMPASVSMSKGACDLEWLPMVWPSSAIRRAIAGLELAQRPWMKKLARVPVPPERVKDRRQVARGAGEVGVLGVDGEGDACAHS